MLDPNVNEEMVTERYEVINAVRLLRWLNGKLSKGKAIMTEEGDHKSIKRAIAIFNAQVARDEEAALAAKVVA